MTFKRPLSRRSALAGALLVAAPAVRAQLAIPVLPPPEAVSMIMPGNIKFRGKLYKPIKTPAPAIIIVHDGWGMTPDFEAMGAALAFEGILGLVVDLAGGKTASDAAQADRIAQEIEPEKPGEIVAVWYDWIRNRLECNGRIGAFGFGPGGRWAVNGSLRKAAHGVATWCVRIDNPPADLASIYETFIGHFSDRGTVPGQVQVADISQRVKQANRDGHFFRYSSGPQFYNPRSPDYDKPDASLAWRRTISIYRKIWQLPNAT